MLVLLILWCGFWGAFASLVGASTTLAVFIGFASVVVPFLFILFVAFAVAIWEEVEMSRRRRRNRARKLGR